MKAAHRTSFRTLASLLVLALLVSFAVVASGSMSLAEGIAYYQVTSSSYDQAVDIPFAVTITARDALHEPVGDGATTLTISSNSHSMVFDTNNNGVFGEDSDTTGTLSGGSLTIRARDAVPARGAIITVTDVNSIQGSSHPYAISPTKAVSADGWGWQNPLPQGNNLRGISGTSSHDVFAVGDAGTIMHYNGAVWIPMPSGTAASLYGVWAGTPTDVYAAGNGGILHYDGLTWNMVRSGSQLRGVWGASSSSVFAAGDEGVFLRYDGEAWTQVSTGTTSNLHGLWGTSSSEAFAVGDGGTLVRYQQGSVSSTSTAGGQTYRGVWGTSSSDVFAVGDNGTIAHYDGATWTAMASGSTNNLCGIWGTSSSDVYAVGDGGTLLHYDGAAWTALSSGTTRNINGVWGSATGNVIAAGDGGLILHREGDGWLPASTGAVDNLRGVWGSSPSDVFAVGEGGTVLHCDGSLWTRMNAGTTDDLYGIWGSSSSDVFAVGGGVILHYDGSTWSTMLDGGVWLTGVWGNSSADVFAVGGRGSILHYDGSTWAPMDSGYAVYMTDVWGTSPSDVFAVGSEGVILHYDGSIWTAMNSGVTAWLGGVGGTSSSDVFAVGGGVILHYDGTAWSQMVVGSTYQREVWASSSSDVFVVGDGSVSHYDGSAWTTMNKGHRGKTYGVWGTSSSDVFAVGDSGAILHYPEPVPVTVASVTPVRGELGQTLDVTIKGSNLEGAASLTFGLGVAVTVNCFTVETPGRITASITIAADAALGARNIHVFTGNGEGRLYSGFTVNEAAPPAAGDSTTGWLLGLWIFLGILGTVLLGAVAFFLSKRRIRRPKPSGPGPTASPEQNPERTVEPVPTRAPVIAEKPFRPLQESSPKQIQPPRRVPAEKSTPEAMPVESISIGALKAILDGRAVVRSKRGPAAGETTASAEKDTSPKKPHPGQGESGSSEHRPQT